MYSTPCGKRGSIAILSRHIVGCVSIRNRCMTKYPRGIVDYFKNSCPAGYTWERSFLFEDGAVCIASADIRLRYINSFPYSFTHSLLHNV